MIIRSNKNEYNDRAKSYLNDTPSRIYVRTRDVFTLHNIRKYFVNFRVKSI